MTKMTKILVSTGVALILCLLVLLRPVDKTPYFLTDYYKSTIARLDSLTQNLRAHTGRIEVGMARVNLLADPRMLTQTGATAQTAGVPLAGYSDRQSAPATSVHDSLYAKAVAVRIDGHTFVLVTLDALIVPVEIAEAVTAKVRATHALEREQILFAATHTHSGIGAWGEGWLAEQFAGNYNPAVRDGLAQQTTLAITRAIEDLQPGQFGHDTFRAPAHVKNRLIGERGRVNDQFDFLVLQQKGGRTAVLGSYAAHATVLTADNFALSGDYPGFWSRAIERELPGLALFFAGSVGSHGPVTASRDFAGAQQLGEALADSVLARMPQVSLQDTLTILGLALQVAMPQLQVRPASDLRVLPALAGQMMQPGRIYLQALRFGQLTWLATPCDFSGELAIDLKNAEKADGRQLIISSFNGGYIGYLLPGKYYHYRSYESHIMSWFGPGMGDYFMEISRRLVSAVSH